MPKQIKDYKTEELKCLVYDQLRQVRLLQQNIQTIEIEINQREQNVGRNGSTDTAADVSAKRNKLAKSSIQSS